MHPTPASPDETNQNPGDPQARFEHVNTPEVTPTRETYPEIEYVYQRFNEHLFESKLPPVLITLQRKSLKVAGYFSPRRFVSVSGGFTDELALNPVLLSKGTTLEGLQTILHEMVHIWQYHLGKPPRRGYHDHQFASKMKEVGLMPSSTGHPGGKTVGQKMSDYPISTGPFEELANEMLSSGFSFPWSERSAEELLAEQAQEDALAKQAEFVKKAPKATVQILETDDIDLLVEKHTLNGDIDHDQPILDRIQAEENKQWAESLDPEEREDLGVELDEEDTTPPPAITFDDLYEAFPENPQDGKIYTFPLEIPQGFELPPGYSRKKLPVQFEEPLTAVVYSSSENTHVTTSPSENGYELNAGDSKPLPVAMGKAVPIGATVVASLAELAPPPLVKKEKSPGRITFICPCKHRIWGKPSIYALCGHCKNQFLPSTEG